ncbi:MAG TPA: hypothetical protein VFE04_06915 [Puia sp.]|nr:hypothetical protein [Puia sp.]
MLAETKSWTGFGGDINWSNPLNWSNNSLPQSTDDVLLDNSALPVSYQVTLPNTAIILKSLLISPSAGRNIELILPVSNSIINALTVTGPGYGIELKAGAVFRNASGLSAGESLSIADSIMIHDGGRYIHQTRASHANNILRILSIAPGTEQGIFDFDVPRASYTISVSNRTYGSLELHSTAQGTLVNYTCSGANPLRVRGNLRIGSSVNMSVDLSSANGNILVEGDFIQEGGQLNLASGTGDNTVLRIMGDLYQNSGSVITETSNGTPTLELNGLREQEIAMGGRIINQVGFRMNNATGSTLRLPLKLPWKLEMVQGMIISSTSALLILDTMCTIIIDSSKLTGVYIEGPLRKLGLNQQDHFLFPVGKNGNLRWLELKSGRGNYTVEYFHQSPVSIGSLVGPGLDHISKLEYWKVDADGTINDLAKIELSFASGQSGIITDPNYLNVARFETSEWEDAGHTATTGNILQGSVLSGNSDFSARYYTLGSVLNFENPLPLINISLEVNENAGQPVFSWVITTDEKPDHFVLYEKRNGQLIPTAQIKAVDGQFKYTWTGNADISAGTHYFIVSMIDVSGNEYFGLVVPFNRENALVRLSWVVSVSGSGINEILIQTSQTGKWDYEIVSIDGRCIKKGILELEKELTRFPVGSILRSRGKYLFRAMDSKGRLFVLPIERN